MNENDKDTKLDGSSLRRFDNEISEDSLFTENIQQTDQDLIEKIYIPVACREISIYQFELSVRLENVLQRLNIESLGDLHQTPFLEIEQVRNCGRKTVNELRELIGKLPDENFAVKFDEECEVNNFSETLKGKISVPQAVKEIPVDYFSFSTRLVNVLNNLAVNTLCDLEKYSFEEIKQTENCGQKTIDELRQFITKLQDKAFTEQQVTKIEEDNVRNESIARIEREWENQPEELIKTKGGKIFVPQSIREISVKWMDVSVALKIVLGKLNVRILGDFEMISINEIKYKNLWKKDVKRLQSFITCIQQNAAPEELPDTIDTILATELNLNDLLGFINKFLNELPDRERDILLDRFGGNCDEKVLTLEEIGEKFNVTRERIRQMESQSIKELKSRLTGIAEAALEKLNTDCLAAICPLTERFLIHLTQNEFSLFEYAPSFYIRLLSELSPTVPIFSQYQTTNQSNKNVKQTRQQIKNLLDERIEFLSLAEVFNNISRQNAIGDWAMKDFFEAIHSNDFIIEPGDSADVLLIATDKNRLTMLEMARQVLEKSEFALKPKAIIEKAREMFGADADLPSEARLVNLPFYERDFYLLDSRTIGLRQHFRLPVEKWKELQDDFYELLKNENRPVSTTEVLAKKLFDWTMQTTASEATEILREDERFKDLGRFLFALAGWQIEEREPVKDLIVKILLEANKPLTATEISERIQKLRSITASSMSTILRGHAEIKTFGFGYYGLKAKGDYREFFATDQKFLKRLVKESAPITFGELCEKLNLNAGDELAEKMWQTLRTIVKLRFAPDYPSAETLITYHLWQTKPQ